MSNMNHQEGVFLNINYRKWQVSWQAGRLIIWKHIHNFAICTRWTPAKLISLFLHGPLLIFMLLTGLRYHSVLVTLIRFFGVFRKPWCHLKRIRPHNVLSITCLNLQGCLIISPFPSTFGPVGFYYRSFYWEVALKEELAYHSRNHRTEIY